MNEEIQHLWALHGLDEKLASLQGQLARFPRERDDLAQKISGERARLDSFKARVHELQLKRRQREKEIEVMSTEERKFQSQLPAVKKNEAYTALLHEIAAVKAKRSNLETDVLVLFEEEDRIQNERPQVELALAVAERAASQRGAQIAGEEGVIRARLDAIEAERATHAGALPAATKARYERVHGSREGRAVVPVHKGACGGCFRNLPPQTLQEARRGERVLSCEGCGRLVVWPPDA